MTMGMPYFLTNKDWYTESYDENEHVHYALTDKAPEEAIRSFEEYHAPIEFYDHDGNSLIPEGWAVVA